MHDTRQLVSQVRDARYVRIRGIRTEGVPNGSSTTVPRSHLSIPVTGGAVTCVERCEMVCRGAMHDDFL